MRPVASPARQRGPAGTLPQPPAQRRAAVKSSPTGPRAARREAVPLDRHAKRSYPPNQQPQRWVEKCDRSVANSETPHLVNDVARHDRNISCNTRKSFKPARRPPERLPTEFVVDRKPLKRVPAEPPAEVPADPVEVGLWADNVPGGHRHGSDPRRARTGVPQPLISGCLCSPGSTIPFNPAPCRLVRTKASVPAVMVRRCLHGLLEARRDGGSVLNDKSPARSQF